MDWRAWSARAAPFGNVSELNDTFEDLGYLLEFLETEMGEKVRAEQARWAEPVPKASFEMLWLLLKPGTDVYFDNGDGTKSAAVISYVTTFGDTKQHRKYNVKFWQMHGAGFDVQPYEHQRTYLRFHGEKPITDLYIFPKQYLTNHDDLNQSLIKQGQLYCSLLAKKCMYFDGQGEAIPGQEFTGSSPTRRAIPPRAYKGNVMLDPERQDIIKKIAVLEPNRPEYVEAMDLKASGLRFCICGRCSKTESELTRPAKFAGYQKVLLSHGEGLTSHQFALCPRQSTTLSTDPSITPWAADFVENKGKGLIFLLHGRPGVGKTYTAEPGLVEQSLRHWLDLGRRWDAIVLLDEADIYMEYRQIHDLARNSLVASFLQAIEYYDGVLFLTTNRIGTFDEAFLSRINALYYGDFSDDDRKRVWNNYFDKLEHEREDIYVPESTRDYVTNENVKALRWNGREIRNAFQVAVNLAQAEGIRDSKGRIVVKRHHIEVTVDLSSDFKDYMKSVRKKDESERALLVGNRDDSYKVALDTSGVESYI
ncbi:hypothetical protein N0V94_003608 [Neodidymelliopsis sp. IMI 364377]|nr:hypothetical protein N0V94_003608 [Neodidymelliopsis sp. IMI 364377]